MTLINDPCLSRDEHRLRDLISEVSEAAFFAGWMEDAEYEVWRLATQGGAWGRTDAEESAGLLTEALSTARRIDRWVIWSERTGCDNEPIPLGDWSSMFRAWADSRDVHRR